MVGTVGPRILVVETDETFRKHLCGRLRLERCRVHEVCGELEARKVLLRKDMDVVLLGLTGGRQPALELLKTIKEMRPLVEVILLRSSEDQSIRASIQCMKLGAFDELLIPFDVETLVRRIQDACRSKGQRESAVRQASQPRGGRDRRKRDPDGQDQSPAG